MESKTEFSDLRIVFEDNKSHFQTGEDVSGVVIFEVKGSTTVANIKIVMIGVTEVEWKDSSYSKYRKGRDHYYEKMIMLNQQYSLPKEYENLCEGSYEVPFKLKLPEKGIPSTFTGLHGSIKYYIEVTNEESGDEVGHRIGYSQFEVNAPSHEKLNLSIGCTKEKDFGLLSLGSGKIIFHSSLSRRGWVPSTILELLVSIENKSTADTTPRATLYQKQVYMFGAHHKAHYIPISETTVGTKVEKQTNFNEFLFIEIPKDIPLTIKSQLINVKYFVHVTFDIPFAFDIHLNLPVIITTNIQDSKTKVD